MLDVTVVTCVVVMVTGGILGRWAGRMQSDSCWDRATSEELFSFERARPPRVRGRKHTRPRNHTHTHTHTQADKGSGSIKTEADIRGFINMKKPILLQISCVSSSPALELPSSARGRFLSILRGPFESKATLPSPPFLLSLCFVSFSLSYVFKCLLGVF